MKPEIRQRIEDAFARREALSSGSADGELRAAVAAVLSDLDAGRLRVAEKIDGHWRVEPVAKQAILLAFRLWPARILPEADAEKTAGLGPAGFSPAYDKVPLKTAGWGEKDFAAAGFRMVPGAVVRHGAYIGKNCVLMPSFINMGAHVGEGTMIDTWATVGSCAQIGRHVHLSGGAGIGGVLEPLQAAPVIIEDHCFIGARSEIAEGVIVEEGAVIAMGTFIGASTKIIDRASGAITMGRVPAYAVVVPGSLPGPALADGKPGPALSCAVIVKRVDAKTRAKTAINELLRGE